jgi:hypothetical protein
MDAKVRELESLIRKEVVRLGAEAGPTVAPHLARFETCYAEELLAVLFYGSCLSPTTRRAGSTPDFFVITKDGDIPAHPRRTRLLHRVLPPTSLTASVETVGVLPAPGALEACELFKYIHLDLEQLDRACGPAMQDLFVAGRLSKRVGLVFCRDGETLERIVAALAAAVVSLVPLVCARLPGRFALPDYLHAAVAISYASEFRIEAAGKVEALIASAPDHYERLHRLGLEIAELLGLVRPEGEGRFSNLVTPRARRRAESLLGRSRRRGLLRWPKHVLTVERWSDVVFQKLERAHPELRPSPLHRRHPLLFGIPYLLLFLSRGYITLHHPDPGAR